MDIDILLALQGLRAALGPAWEAFFALVTSLPMSPVTYAIPVVLYYVVDKEAGLFLLASFGLGATLNNLLKNLACVYRPWVRDSRIHPAPEALPAATGYSFPSGHTQAMGSIWLGWGWRWRRRHGWLFWATLALTLLVGFSRCFLGVHTPQDVLMGLAVSVAMLLVAEWVVGLVRDHPERDVWVLVSVLAAVVACVLVVTFKPYPRDYVDGRLLVDPEEMVLDAYRAFGMLGGTVVGWFLERRLVGFSTGEGDDRRERALRLVAGLVLALAGFLACLPLKAASLLPAYYLASGLVPLVLAVWAGPAVARLVAGRLGWRAAPGSGGQGVSRA